MKKIMIVQINHVINNQLTHNQQEFPVFAITLTDDKITFIGSLFSSLSELQRFYVGTEFEKEIVETNITDFHEFSLMLKDVEINTCI